MHKICSGTAQSKNGWGGSEGVRERREPISNSLGSMCAAGWIERKEGRKEGGRYVGREIVATICINGG